MKLTIIIAATAVVAGTLFSVGASSADMSRDQKLQMYRAHAGAPIPGFHFSGHLDGWTPLDDETIAIWTRPREAYLLDLSTPCQDIEYGQAIGLTSTMHQVSAKLDNVLVNRPGSMGVPCRIDQIRPLDVNAIKQAENTARDQSADPGSDSGV